MRKLNIAMVVASPYPANHGTPGSIREMAEAICKLGHNIHIVTYPYGEGMPGNGIHLHRSPRLSFTTRIKTRIKVGPSYEKIFLDMLVAGKLCQVIKKENIDIIHAHNYEGAIAGYLAKLVTGRPLVYNAVNTMRDELHTYNFIRPQAVAKGIARFLDYTVPRTADLIMAISDELVQFLLSKKINPHRIARIPLGVDPDIFEGKDPTLIRKSYGIGKRPLVVYTGILNEFQRVDYMLKAMRIVVNKLEEATLLIVPNIIDPYDLKRHRALVRELNIEQNVIFADERPFSEVPHFLAAADVAVLSRPECPGFPVKLLNYMVAGKAIVAFQGSSKGLEDMKNAILVEDHNWRGMGEGILSLLLDPKLAKTLGNNARGYALHTYSWEKISGAIEKIYLHTLSLNGQDRTIPTLTARTHRYYDRRQSNEAITSSDRRRADRRLKNICLYHPEKRKPNSLKNLKNPKK